MPPQLIINLIKTAPILLCVMSYFEYSVIFFDARRQVLTEALVSRILFDDCDVGKDVTATGVEFIHDGQTYKVMATKEVVLSAG